jgi:cell division protein ZapA (FtsZ GTPase activity inhibitor)
MSGRMKVKLGGKQVEVRVYRDTRHTLRLAESINARLKAIESESGRIDTQAFALQAAFAAAAEAQDIIDNAEGERTEMLKELDRLSKAVDKLTREFRRDEKA